MRITFLKGLQVSGLIFTEALRITGLNLTVQCPREPLSTLDIQLLSIKTTSGFLGCSYSDNI